MLFDDFFQKDRPSKTLRRRGSCDADISSLYFGVSKMNRMNPKLAPEHREELLRALKARFEKNMSRHKGLEWAKVRAKLEANTEKMWSLNEMERTGGEP